MRKTFAVLFEDKIFSKTQNNFGYKSELLDPSIQKIGDEYFSMDPFWGDCSYTKNIPDRLFIFDPIETYFYNERIKNIKNGELNLEFIKKVIVDEHYPAFLEYYPEKHTYIDDYGLESEIPNLFYIDGGRNSLLRIISENRYSEALPQLREIALHDDSQKMRSNAIFTTKCLQRKKSDDLVNEILGITDDRYLIMDICHYIKSCSLSNIFIKNLRKKFEEHYLDYVDNYLSLKWMSTVPQSIISLCGSILTIDSLLLIEEGIKHPYPHVEQNAKHSLYVWIDRVVKNKIDDQILMKKVVEVCKKYDIGYYFEKDSWKKFKKWSDTLTVY